MIQTKKEIQKVLRSLNTTKIFAMAKKANIDVSKRSEVFEFIRKYSPTKKVSKYAYSIAYSHNTHHWSYYSPYLEYSETDIIHAINYAKYQKKRGYDNYSKIIDQLNSRNIEVFIQSVLYVAKKYPNSKEINSKVLELNNRLIELANDKNIKFIELNLILSEDKFLKEKYQNDGIHLNGEAYQLWANEIKTFVK